MTDVFLYNADIVRQLDLQFIELVSNSQNSEDCTLILITNGGDADAAYKISRYLQERYESYTVLVSGLCKSAGTLIAIGASEIAFAPFGELGPLDVQVTKQDDLGKMESGLNISEAFKALEGRATDTYHRLIAEIFQASGGIISTQTALHAATEMVASIYGPIFGQIDPEEVGSRSRAMRIGEQYAERLDKKFRNLKSRERASDLSRHYPSHGFVIDYTEACSLFNKVRKANDDEMKLVKHLGKQSRFPDTSPTIRHIDIPDISPNERTEDGKRAKGSKPNSKP